MTSREGGWEISFSIVLDKNSYPLFLFFRLKSKESETRKKVKNMKKGFIPEQCALWKKQNIEESDVRFDAFDLVKTYIDTSHLWRYLLKCKECGQLYFFEFYEEINWLKEGNGNDYQYSTWIPVAPNDAESLKDKSPLELLDPALIPRIQADSTPKGENAVHWVR